MNYINQHTTTGNLSINSGSIAISDSKEERLTINIPHEVANTVYGFDLGDIVVCKKEGKYLGKLGKISDRKLKLEFDVDSKSLTNLRMVGQYFVDFNNNNDNDQNYYTQGVITANWVSPFPKFSENELELAYKN